ncbi:Cytosolic phospholipase A2 epsilon [Chelonia mydas]|uniref:Phospholipase A2 n=1 Tax=Chelonia mydas TaxID=8469 RepID=M7BUU2_CHEMY|nr:Cytosolic phospholipase A2 epsilon [Chelonia mydas]
MAPQLLPDIQEVQMEPSPCNLLSVKVIRMKNLRKADLLTQSDCYVSLWLPTASVKKARTKTVKNSKNPVWNETFHFRIQSQVKNILELKVCDEDEHTPDDHLLTVFFDVSKIQLGETVRLNFLVNPQGKEELEVEFTMESRTQGLFNSSRKLDVRLGFDLCPEEQNFLKNRKKLVAAALKKVLRLEEDLKDHEVPVVAVTTTGGGIRALTAMYGSILGLQKLNVLDCVSYITGSSGTTWTMTNLYEDDDWSQKDLGELIIEARKQASKSKMSAFSLESLKNYHRELSQRTQAGYKTSFIDLWGLMIESMLNDEKEEHKLSDQQQAVNWGQNPLPIYLALNVKDNITTKDFREWVEFTPYEVGFLKYGAFIRAEDFGSEFFMGRLMKKLPESRICFMQEEEPDLPERPHEMATCMYTPAGGISNALRDILTDRPAVSKYHSFLRGFQMHNEYTQHEQFSKWKEQGIPFPKPVLNEEERKNLKECYMFEDAENPSAPILLYFPLVNDSFQRYIAPGVERSASEIELGKVDVSSFYSPYSTREVSLKAQDFNKLLKLTNYNIQNNENLILQALHAAASEPELQPELLRLYCYFQEPEPEPEPESFNHDSGTCCCRLPLAVLDDLNIKTNPLGNVKTKHGSHCAAQENTEFKMELSPCYLLTVRIIRMRNLRRADTLSHSDCYISLQLPTSTCEKIQTKTVNDCKNPVWNETFYFRIQSQIKAQEELEVEFTLENMHSAVHGGRTGGKLLLHPDYAADWELQESRALCCLEVQVDEKKRHKSRKDLSLTVKGSHEGTQYLRLGPDAIISPSFPTKFHYVKYMEPTLNAMLPKKKRYNARTCTYIINTGSPVMMLNSLPMGERITVAEEKRFDLHVKAEDCPCSCPQDLDVRLGYDLCAEEKDFLSKRKKYVAAALKNVLQLEEDLQDHEIPVVAIMTTGGGMRSFTTTYGSLLGLKKLNVLDCATYLSGLSGTTWTMSCLYKDAYWSQKDLDEKIREAQKCVTKCKMSCFSMDRMKYFNQQLCQRKREGYRTSFIDLWGLIIEYMLHDGKENHKLSDQQEAVNEGQNPLPIYVAVNVRDKYSTLDFKGMWSSVFSLNLLYIWSMSNSSEDFWHRWTRDRVVDIEEEPVLPTRPHEVNTHMLTPEGPFSTALRDALTDRLSVAQYHNFLKGFQLHNDYLGNEKFCRWKDTVLDMSPNQLSEQPDLLGMVDAGFFINTSCAPLLRSERKVDVILHLSYSAGSQTLPLDQACKYYAEQKIPFPKVFLSEEDRKNLKECYLFQDSETPGSPIVVFFPLVNDTFQYYKAPGVTRCCSETEGGKVDVTSCSSPYDTFSVRYTDENYRWLDKKFDLYVKATDCSEDLDVRLGFDLCTEEQDFLCKRKKCVAAALKKVLQLEEDLQDDEIPVVAIMTTGGGMRSLTTSYGSLLGLQKLNVIDCAMYLTGLSGTTWTMANLYRDADWSQKDLSGKINEARKHVTKCKMGSFSMERIKYYNKQLCQRKQEGHRTSSIDLWGLIVEYLLHDGKDNHKLSDQRQAVHQGQNPLPIYVAINVKDNYSTLDFKEWLEFTPYEVGFMKYGAFIRSEDFGSEFFMGRLMKRLPESRISYLEEEESVLSMRPHEQKTQVFTTASPLSRALRSAITERTSVAQYHSFLKGLQLHNDYLENDKFCRWKDTVLDTSPNQLTETAEYLSLVDTGFFINTSCPPLLRPERKVDVILHLNYSAGSQILPLDQSCKYYSEQGIPFPKVVLSEEERKKLKECYLFDDAETPGAPILLFFPLVNDTYQSYKAPGVKRSSSEMEEGKVDLTSCFSPYSTYSVTYKEQDYDQLIKLTEYNILNNKHLILQALRKAVERKRQHKK